MSGIFAGLIPHNSGGGGNPLSSSFAGSDVEYERNGATAVAAATFKTDGTCEGSGVDTLVSDTLTGTKWFAAAPSGGIGSSYWFLVTPISGTLSSNNASSWTQGTIDIAFSVSMAVAGNKTCTARVDISATSGGTILATGNVTVTVERFP